MHVTEPIETNGHFWLPSNPENKKSGCLFIKQGGEVTLELLGSFDQDLSLIHI